MGQLSLLFSVSATGLSQDGMYIRQIDRNAIQIQSKDHKQELGKVQNAAQNVQMITVPQGMTVLQNPLNIGQVPVLGQPNSQVYMIPTNTQNLGTIQGALPPGLIGQQMLPGQNVQVLQPNQLGVPGGVQYNVPLMPMNMQANSQYMPGINLNTQLSAQQLNAALAGQLNNPNLAVSGTIPIVQAPPASSPLTGAQIPVSQPPPVHQILQQNSFITPTSQYASMPQQYMMSNNSAITVPANNPNVQYSIPPNQNATSNNGNGQPTQQDTENTTNSQTNYITSSSQEGYLPNASVPSQNYPTDGSNTQTNFTQPQSVTPNYSTNGSTPTQAYATQTTSQPPPNYPANGANQNANYGTTTPSNSQNNQSFSPSTTPAPNQNYPAPNMPNMPPNQNPYPNATGQNLAAYASNQYQYNSRPWFRPRYGSPQGSPYSSGTGPPPNGPPMPVPPPSGYYNYWQDS